MSLHISALPLSRVKIQERGTISVLLILFSKPSLLSEKWVALNTYWSNKKMKRRAHLRRFLTSKAKENCRKKGRRDRDFVKKPEINSQRSNNRRIF